MRKGSTGKLALAAAMVVAVGAWVGAQPEPQPPAPASQPEPAQATPQIAPPPEPAVQEDEPREAVVTLKDGQRYTGVLVERGEDKVVLRIAGIMTPIPASQVQRVAILPPISERYRAMRSAIDDNDVDSLVKLAEWLRARSQWDAALAELDHVLAVQPGDVEARRMRTLVQSQKRLAEKSRAGKPRSIPASQPAATGTVGAPGGAGAVSPTGSAGARPEAFPVLSDRDVNLMKVYEVDLSDPPRMIIERDTVRRLIEGHSGDPLIPGTAEGREAMYRLSPARILDLMFRMQARDLYGEVRVIDEPRSMRLFRDNVHRVWILNSCATTRCHGGTEAGRLMLFNQRPNTDSTVYTNLLILDRFRLADGKPLVNYDDPASSPLLQMALPRQNTAIQHPVVPATEGRGDLWRPFFKSPEDRRFQEAVQWIKSMYRPRPQYPVQYTPPSPQPIAPPTAEAPVAR